MYSDFIRNAPDYESHHIKTKRLHVSITPIKTRLALLIGFISVISLSCSSLFECGDTTQTTEQIDESGIVIKNYCSVNYSIYNDGEIQVARNIGVNFRSSVTSTKNLLPSFSGNNLAVSINGSRLRYAPLNMAAGGIHGSCPDWRYDEYVFYHDTSLSENVKVSLYKGESVTRQWNQLFSIAPESIPLVSDTVLSDTAIRVSIHCGDTTRLYSAIITDNLGNSINLTSVSNLDRDNIFEVRFDTFNHRYTSVIKSSNYFGLSLAITGKPKTAAVHSNDSILVNEFQFNQQLSDASKISFIKYLNSL